MAPTDRTRPHPWSRTWTGLAVLSVVIGLLYATVPYSRGTVALEGHVVTVDCAAPAIGMWRSDAAPTARELASGELESSCAPQARERVAVGVVLVLVGAGGVVALHRRRRAEP